jgi:hypothetical protein
MESQFDDRARMTTRHEIVMGLIDVNVRQMRCDNQRHGIEIERQTAVRDAALPGAPSNLRESIEGCNRRLAELDEENLRLMVERDWLSAALASFDAAGVPSEKGDHNG